MPNNPRDNNAGLGKYADALVKTIKNIHGDEVKPMYVASNLPLKAKTKKAVFNAKPESATDDCYIIGFQDSNGLLPSLVNDAANYAEAISKDYDRIDYKGVATVGNTVVVYFDKTEYQDNAEGLEKIAQQYKAPGRAQFIADIIQAARAAGVEDLLISHWPTQTS